MATLTVVSRSGAGEPYTLGESAVLGRGAHCDIPLDNLDDLGVSRRHARIRKQGDCYIVEDLGSKNGTLVNALPRSSAELHDGDEITLGSVQLVFRDDQAAVAPSSMTSVVVSDYTPTGIATNYSKDATKLRLPQRRLEQLYELSERLTTLRTRDELLEDVLAVCVENLNFERAAIAIRKPDGRGVEWPVVRNLRGPKGELTISRSVLARALEHGERAVIHESDGGDIDPTVSMVQHGIRSAMCVPMQHRGKVLGVIYGDRTTTGTVYANEDVDFLAGLARLVSVGLINAQLMEQQEARLRLEHEVALARTMQEQLFPRELPNTPALNIAALNRPGRHVSGDYYDVIALDDGRVAFIIADVTGEGVAAALIMANLQAAVRVTLPKIQDLADLLAQWNRLIHANTASQKFVTCLAGILDPAARRLTAASAGHFFPYLLRGDGEACPVLSGEPGFPLGVMDTAEYATFDFELGDGPCGLFCYTDGVIEAMDLGNEQYSTERLEACLAAMEEFDPAVVIRRVDRSLAEFCNGATQSDDITMLSVALA